MHRKSSTNSAGAEIALISEGEPLADRKSAGKWAPLGCRESQVQSEGVVVATGGFDPHAHVIRLALASLWRIGQRSAFGPTLRALEVPPNIRRLGGPVDESAGRSDQTYTISYSSTRCSATR
jgi:hypothetical protein